MEETRSLISILSKEKNSTQSILSSLRSLEKMVEFPEKNLHKIKAEISKIDKKLAVNSLIDPIKEEIETTNENYKEQIPAWEEKAKKCSVKSWKVFLQNTVMKSEVTIHG